MIDETSPFLIQSGSIQSIWNTFAGGNSTLASVNASGDGTYPSGQSADNLFDNKTSTKYLSRGNASSGSNAYTGLHTGFHVTIAQCQPKLAKFRFATITSSTNSTTYDPISITIEGTECSNLMACTTWTLLYNGTTGLNNVTARGSYGDFQNIPSPQAFTSYRFLVTKKKASSSYVAYSEVELYGH